MATSGSVRKILHAADVHLDSPMRNLEAYPDAPIDAFVGATRRALSNLVDVAIRQRVDLVVIAGDLYDGDWDDAHTGLYFVGQAARLREAGIPLVMIRGNHDAALRMTQSIELPRNPDGSEILMAHDRVDRRVFESLGIVVHGRSFATQAETADLASQYPDAIRGMFNLGLLHTCLTGSEGHQDYAPTSPERLRVKGYDYWALGHIHDRRECQGAGDPPIVFSGNTQGRHIREVGPKGCLILNVDPDNRVESRFVPLDVARWGVMHHDATEDADTDGLLAAFRVWLSREIAASEGRPLAVRVRVSGRTAMHDRYRQASARLENDLRSVALQSGIGQVWLESLRLRTSPPRTRREGELESAIRQVFGEIRGKALSSADHDRPEVADGSGSDGKPLSKPESQAIDPESQAIDPERIAKVASWVKPLWDKLPTALIGDPIEPFAASDPGLVARWLEDAEPGLLGRFGDLEDGA
jgi:DNA repair exonuclease SbcCD nuclease subunit